MMDSFQHFARWDALRVRPRFERIVAATLYRRDVEFYMPLRRISRTVDGRKRSIELPLFPKFVFFRSGSADERALFMIPGVLGTARATYSQGLSGREMIDLRRIVNAGSCAPWPFVTEGKSVVIQTGVLRGVTGILKETPDKRLLIFSLPLIRRSIAIEMDDRCVVSIA